MSARLAAAALLLLLCAALASAQGSVVARATGVTGQAVLTSAGSSIVLTPGFILNPGDRIDTRGGGRVVIELSDGSMVIVAPDSVVTLKDFRAAASLRELFEITLGAVRVKINHFGGKPNPYRMNSPTASIAVRGTEFSIEVDSQGGTQVTVYEGAVEVSSLSDPSRQVLIEAGRAVLVQAGQDFHLIGANLAPGGNRDNDSGRRGGQANNNGPAQAHPPDGREGMPPNLGAPAQQPAAQQPPAQQPPPGNYAVPPQKDHDDSSPRANAGTYDRYLAGLADIGQVPFLLRFNAFPEAHLDSLENPAYATTFTSPEGRVFFLPTFRGAQTLSENQTAFGPSSSLPTDYSISPQVSFFAPVGGFVFGGAASASRVGGNSLNSTPDYDPGMLPYGASSTGSSASTFYTGTILGARRAGANSFGFELSSLKGTGSLATTSSEIDGGPGHLATEQLASTSDITQTRLTLGYSRDFSRDVKLGVYYRYAFIQANDHDTAHTINAFPAGLNSTLTGGHSSELGIRLRGLVTRRLYYGVNASWLGISLLDGMVRTNTVDSHQRDRAQRGSAAIGLGYSLTRRTVLTFDLAGGASRTTAGRTEDSSGNLLQNSAGDNRFVSVHTAIQHDLTRRLFLSASYLHIWQSGGLDVDLFPDRYGNRTSVSDAFFPLTPLATAATHFSDYGVGWRFTPNLFVQYVYSTDYGVSAATHTLMLRYTLRGSR